MHCKEKTSQKERFFSVKLCFNSFFENNFIKGIKINDETVVETECVVLAIGHSARDTFRMLHEMKIPMEAKPFAMGVRIEHKQSMVDLAQYGKIDPVLPPADYKLVKHLDDATAYTFCMCPGGYVVAAASERGRVVTNGMSYKDRSGENANAALLVTVNPQDFPTEGPLGGMLWQEEIEQLFRRKELLVEKKGKNGTVQQDIIPMIRKMEIVQTD